MNAASARDIHSLRPQMLERRARLSAAAGDLSAGYLNDLLAEVDSALHRIDHGTYGICEACHESIEADRLKIDPLVRFCLDHLNERDRRAHEQDLQLAMEIQSRLLPPCDMAIEDWSAHYHYVAAGPVGGDYCEVLSLRDGKSLFFAVGDVSGKGVAASLLMTHLSAIFRSLMSLHLPLGELMSRANRLFCESTLDGQYATLVCGRTTADGVELCIAGHCPALILRAETVDRFENPGLPLGLFCKVEYPLAHVDMAECDRLVLYTDGVTEAEGDDGCEFGEDRLIQSLRRHFGCRQDTLAQRVAEDVDLFRGGCRATDDLTVLVLRRHH